ncbi:MAG TPA: class I SAM-dependent rRNA methyltransferase [Patescibacteria group bacterium]|nr:class I SAM-dependent rRNA methyltransferase [Patescibacteria group bacterium]
MTTLTLKNKHDRRLKSGHLWVFSNELESIPTDIKSGSLVQVVSARGESFGTGVYNPQSLIAVRLLKTDAETLDTEFFAERFKRAKELRARLFPGEHTYRLIFGESDFLPGLVIDRFEDYFSLQILSAGMEKHLPQIQEALLKTFPDTNGIFEKNTSHLRNLEGLELREGVIWGKIPEEIKIYENGIQLSISLLKGQKTGYFLDQRLNRQRVADFSPGLKVLDCFTNQGGFALNAEKGGACEVLGVDISQTAVDAGFKNAKLNNFTDKISFKTADVFEFLKAEVAAKNSWDMIILDPPAFTKSRKTVPAAKKGYASINRLALQLIEPGGYLVTSSCSQHLEEQTFYELIQQEADHTQCELQLVFRGMQSPDHPVLPQMPETQYLKFFIFRVLK